MGIAYEPASIWQSVIKPSHKRSKWEPDMKSAEGIIVNDNGPKTLLSRIANCRGHKRVRFNHRGETCKGSLINLDYVYFNKPTHKPASKMTDDEISRVHYRTKDYVEFRLGALEIASEVRRQTQFEHRQKQLNMMTEDSFHSYDTVMTKTYQMCAIHSLNIEEEQYSKPRQDDNTNQHIVDFINHRCLTPHLFESLTHWVKTGDSRRGLEKFSVPFLTDIRQLNRKAVMLSVLTAQNMLNSIGECCEETDDEKSVEQNVSQCDVLGWLENDRDVSDKEKKHSRMQCLERLGIPNTKLSPYLSNEEVIRIVAEKHTSASKLFALTMGHADAAAL